MMTCRVCDTFTTLNVYDIFQAPNTQQKIGVYLCNECHSFFIDSVPYNYQLEDDLVSYYLPIKDILIKRYNSVFKYVDSLGKQGRFLDIGCGIGYSLLVAEDWEWDAVGIEPNPYLVDYSQSKFGLNIVNDFFNAQNFPLSSFDFIIVDQVLEHLYNIHPFFEDVIGLLKPNGILMIAVPPVDWFRLLIARVDPCIGKSKLPLQFFKHMSPNFRIFYDLEQHVNYFTQRSFLKLVGLQNNLTLLPKFHNSKVRELACKILRLSTGYFFIQKGNSKTSDDQHKLISA